MSILELKPPVAMTTTCAVISSWVETPPLLVTAVTPVTLSPSRLMLLTLVSVRSCPPLALKDAMRFVISPWPLSAARVHRITELPSCPFRSTQVTPFCSAQ